MLINKLLKAMLGAAAVAALLSAPSVHAQTGAPQTGTSGMAGQSTSGTSGSTDTSGQTTSGQSSSGQTTSGQDTSGQSTSGGSGTSGATGQGATGTGATAGAGSQATTATISKADRKLLMDMAQGNMAEVEMGRLAQSKSQNDEVKTFAQQMIDDHTKALTEIQQLAQAKGVTLPTEMDKKHKAMADKMSAMSGEAFDRNYMKEGGVSDHKKMHALLKRAQSKAKDPELKALAERLMPTVDQHLKSAQQLHGAKGTTKDTKGSATGAGSDEKSKQ